MSAVDVRIRAPTATAWAVTLGATIIAGELYYELQKSKIATFFGRPFTDDELWPPVIAAVLVAIVGLVWLISLYVRPGRLRVDAEADRVVRRVRPHARTRVIEGPLAAWRARVVFYSPEDRARGIFKRIELARDDADWREVILFSDVRDGEELAAALMELEGQLGALDIEVIRASS